MTVYSAESFYRAKISESILSTTAVPITIVVSKLPTLTSGLLTISPNTEFEEIVEYDNPVSGTMTIDIIKRGINPKSILLTTDTVDYNNTTFMMSHTQNDIIRGDVNHIHINQGIGNSTLATNTGVGISKLSVAATDPGDPIVVGTNDPRVGDASATVKATVKLSVAPASASNPIAVGDNDTRLTADTIVSANGFAGSVSAGNAHTISTTVTGVLKGNGTAMSAASAGTDYYAPSSTDVAVADGGTGRSSHTAYAPIFGGTTSTAAQQSGTVGTAGQVLTSNGAGALPTFQSGIVKNGTLTTTTVTSGGTAGTYQSGSSGLIAGATVARINLSSSNVCSTQLLVSDDNSIFSTLYNAPVNTAQDFHFMLQDNKYYKTQVIMTSTGTPGTGTLTYTV